MRSGEPTERDSEPTDEGRPAVAASHTSPDRTVFTEEGNVDAWIATSLTVSLDR